MITKETIEKCKQQQRAAQRYVYEHMATRLYNVCNRYLRSREEVEEALADAFYAIFTRIEQLKDAQAFEGWCRSITVHQCLNRLRSRQPFMLHIDSDMQDEPYDDTVLQSIHANDLMNLVSTLPDGCRTVFNLYAIEGYSHKEIAKLLHISEGTSKSQLNFSRKKLQGLVNQYFEQTNKSHEQST